MNHKTYHLMALAALLFAGAAFTACSTSSSDNEIIDQTPAQPTTGKYTLTVNATKVADAATRALSLDENTNTLNATWKYGDVVYVTKESGGLTQGEYGKLMATNVSADGLSCTLTGSISGQQIGKGDVLTLRYHYSNYPSQEGTIDYIAEKCDVAIATVTVDKVENGLITTTGNANFESQQAIVKFSLKQPDGTTSLAAEYLLVKVNYLVGNDKKVDAYEVIPNAAMSDIYVAIPGSAEAKVTLTALSSSGKFTYTKSSVTFQNGKYYAISVKMKQAAGGIQDLSTLNAEYEAPDCTVLTGTLSGTHKVSIAAGATVILKNVTINGENYDFRAAGITCIGSATIILAGTNKVKGATGGNSGIYVPQSGKLTIKGSGSLVASGNGSGAGIGARYNYACGKIRIEGGTITATGGQSAAGIGGANKAPCGDITITGGNVSATGGEKAAGIGSGYMYKCDDITITGGNVSATGGQYAAGIGSGNYGKCGDITITSGVTHVTATKGTDASNSIGAGEQGTCGTVTIEDPSKVTQN